MPEHETRASHRDSVRKFWFLGQTSTKGNNSNIILISEHVIFTDCSKAWYRLYFSPIALSYREPYEYQHIQNNFITHMKSQEKNSLHLINVT